MTSHTARIEDAERMRAMAEEYRAIADNTKDPTCRRQLLGVARTYEKIAALVEQERIQSSARPSCDAARDSVRPRASSGLGDRLGGGEGVLAGVARPTQAHLRAKEEFRRLGREQGLTAIGARPETHELGEPRASAVVLLKRHRELLPTFDHGLGRRSG